MTYPDPPYMDGSQPCAGADSEAWFPEVWSNANRAAVAICGTCHYRDPCLEYALHVNVVGIWGGTTDAQRRRLRRERGIKVIPVWMTMFAPSPGALRLRLKRAEQRERDQ